MNTTLLSNLVASASVVVLTSLGCAHDPSKELLTARETYQEAANGEANREVPAEVYEAKKALDRAESVPATRRHKIKQRDLAYVATRKAQLAIARAEMRKVERDEREAVSTRIDTLQAQRDHSADALARNKSELVQKQRTLNEKEEALSEKEEALERARAERRELEQQLSSTMADLQEMANLKREQDRMVITLNGSLLFKHDSSDLLASANRKLKEVAVALKDHAKDNKIVVEGHTDATGSADYNATLSLKRAQAVQQYLVNEGVPRESLDAVGRGEDEPIANNSTAEGRANNRRVEIIVDAASPTTASR